MRHLIIGVLLSTSLLLAKDTNFEQLFDLDIDDLQNINVVTATKDEVSISHAPSTIRVITANMIESRGYKSLEEALSSLPGLQFRNIQGFNSYTFMRGAASQNNLILLMIDGIPINELNSGGFYGGLQHNLASLERIEVMYGPGSVLYGSNAISGVINLITKRTDKKSKTPLKSSVTYGSFNTQNINTNFNDYDENSSVGYNISAMYVHTNKADLGGSAGADNWSSSMENFETDLSFDAKISYKSLTVGAVVQDKRTSRTTNYKTEDSDYYDRNSLWHIVFANIWAKHQWQIDGRQRLSSTLYYRDTTVVDDTIGYVKNSIADSNQTGYYRPNHSIGWEERYTYTFNSDIELTLGTQIEANTLAQTFSKSYSGAYDVLPTAPVAPEMISENLMSLYGQAFYKITPYLELTASWRHERRSDYEAVNTPRVALVFNNKDSNIKLLYGEAFRAPKPWDYTYGSGNTALLPEEMQSIELFAEHRFLSGLSAQVSLFKNAIDSKLVIIDDRWDNLGRLDVNGMEVAMAYQILSFDGYCNYTYTDSKDENGNRSDEIADHVLHTGMTYKGVDKMLMFLDLSYVSSKQNPSTDSTLPGYALLNTKLTYDVLKNMNIDLMIDNVLDSVYYDTSNRPVTQYRQNQRSYYVRLGYDF